MTEAPLRTTPNSGGPQADHTTADDAIAASLPAAEAASPPAEVPTEVQAGKRVFIKTYGCQMNVYDSQRMADLLRPLGYAPADAPEGADLVILNTCHIREKAAEKVYSELGRLAPLKDSKAEAGGRMTVAVAGCVAQAEGEEIMRRAPAVDLVLGPQSYHRLPEMIALAHRASGRALAVEFDAVEKFDRLSGPRSVEGLTAFVTAQEGCDKFCSFCVVPYTRGAEWSRPPAQILAEVEGLVAQGVREVTLLGQNVNAYRAAAPHGGGDWGLAELIAALARIDDLARIRFTTSHPLDMDEALIAAFGSEPKLMPYLHLPVQSGSDRILAAMNRRHTAAEYEEVVARVRAAQPDIALSGDFIVGFPGETEAEFEATLGLIRRVGYASAFAFKYSARPGTPAAGLPRQIPEAEKEARLAALQALLDAQALAFNKAQVGRRLPVLIEGPGRAPGQVRGKSPYLQGVHAPAPPGAAEALRGRIVEVEIETATRGSLQGRLAAIGAETAAKAVAEVS